jgi:serine/threonine-protein kinase
VADEAPNPKPEDFLGRTLDGRYRLDAVLGQGGMGMVFRATQTSMSRPVAVKTLHPNLAMAPTFYERFKREAELASRLHHPNIITIYDFGRDKDGTCYYVMELLEGESLRQLVKREGPMTLRRATAVLEQAALGVAHAHRQGVVHRDIKPHNIMISRVDEHEFVKVLDFGLVKALEAEEEEQLTSTGQVLGTPQYMPPEQAGGESVDPRSDLYSLTGVLFYTLTGTSPFGAKTVRKALQAALTLPAPTIGSMRVGAPVPEGLDAWVKKGLAIEKADRFKDADTMISELHAALEGASDAVLDAMPQKSGQPPSKESGSGSSAAEKSGRPSTSSKHGSVPKALPRQSATPVTPAPELGDHTKSVPFDRKVTAPAMEALSTAKQPAHEVKPASSFPKVVAVMAPVMLLAAGATWWFLKRGQVEELKPNEPVVVVRKEPPAEPKKPEPELLSVTLKSTPTGAQVLEDGVLVGTTPLERKWPKETTHSITFQLAGFVDLQRSFRLDKNESFEVELTAAKKVSGTSSDKGKPKPKPGDGIEAFE